MVMTTPSSELVRHLTELLAKADLHGPLVAYNKFWIRDARDSTVARLALDDFDAAARSALIVEALNAMPTLLALLSSQDKMREALESLLVLPLLLLERDDLPQAVRGILEHHWRITEAREALHPSPNRSDR